MTPKKDLELYLHIPFCRQKCRYCDFLSAPLAVGTPGDADVRGMDARREIIRNAGSGQQSASATDAHVPESYVDALITQIVQESQFYQERRVTTIFWGGGTPSLLRVMDMERLMDAIRTHFCVADDAEITLESNPGTLDFEKLAGYRRAGINRLSMGLQSACDKELAMLGRIHNFDTFVQNYKQARRAGFENINVDLMSALPGQTVESWEQTLVKTAELGPEHLSAYSLIIEEGTPFYEKYGEGERAEARRRRELPDEDTERMMYQFTKNILWSYGYHRYEISNYAKEGYECRHNLGYWNRTEYLGIGTGAASLINNQRFVEGGEIEVLSLQNQMEEYMFLGLRKIEGVSKTDFRQTFGRSIENAYGKVLIDMYQKQLLEDTGEYIRLTEKGIDVSNYVMSEFLF